MTNMYLTRKTGALLRHNKKSCILGVSTFLLFLYWNWYSEEIVQIGTLGWVKGKRELNRHVWRELLPREGEYTVQGCTLPKLDPWGLEVKKFVSSIPQVRFSSLLHPLFHVL